jgi:serpin B
MTSRQILRLAACKALLLSMLSFPAVAGEPATPEKSAALDTAALAETYNLTGHELYEQFRSTPGNIVFSPYSIGAAMAMVRTGARGETGEEMAKVLKHQAPREAIDTANAELSTKLNSYDRSSSPGYCAKGAQWTGKRCEAPAAEGRNCTWPLVLDGDICAGVPVVPSARLAVANALMLIRQGDLISSDYRALLKDKYAAEVFQGATLETVNGWVKERSENKIDKILDEIAGDSVAVLLNAVYFKAAWAAPFAKSATRRTDFHLTRWRTVDVPMMRQEANIPMVSGPGYTAIRLPYSQKALGMVIVLPDEVDGVNAVARRLDASKAAQLFRSLDAGAEKPVALSLPRFKASFVTDLTKPFEKAGIKLAFSKDADFSGMTTAEAKAGSIVINQIRHRTVIEVAEEGTEAAAATAVAMTRGIANLARPKSEPFVADHPFLFYVIDNASGAILFQGRLSDPGAR